MKQRRAEADDIRQTSCSGRNGSRDSLLYKFGVDFSTPLSSTRKHLRVSIGVGSLTILYKSPAEPQRDRPIPLKGFMAAPSLLPYSAPRCSLFASRPICTRDTRFKDATINSPSDRHPTSPFHPLLLIILFDDSDVRSPNTPSRLRGPDSHAEARGGIWPVFRHHELHDTCSAEAVSHESRSVSTTSAVHFDTQFGACSSRPNSKATSRGCARIRNCARAWATGNTPNRHSTT